MAWIELHQAIWTHRKTFILAAELNIDETYAAAHMIRLWTWALDNAPDGDLSGLPPKVIAYGAGWRGDAEAFVEASIKAGWLDRDNESLVIHDWYDYAGRLIEKRRKDMERKRKERESHKDVQRTSNGHPKDGAGNLTKPNQTDHDHSGCLTTSTAQGAEAAVDKSVDKPTNQKLIAELTESYRAIEGIKPANGDYAFIGALYNKHGYDQVLDAINKLQMAAAVQQLEKPLLYLKGILEKQEREPPKKSPPRKVDEKKKQLLRSLYLS